MFGFVLFECLHLYITIRNLFHRHIFEGALAKLPKTTISVVMSACPYETMGPPLDGFSWNYVFLSIFRKSVEKVQFLLKSDKNNGYIA